MKSNIYLIGFMGTGKSTIAKKLSYRHQLEVVEMDEEIVKDQHMAVSKIFEVYGEPCFRDLETKLLIKLQDEPPMVVSCGGGLVLREENVRLMKKMGTIVLLTASPQTIYERVKNSTKRPILNGNMNLAYITELMEKRRSYYEQAADTVISTDDKTAEASCGEILEKGIWKQ